MFLCPRVVNAFYLVFIGTGEDWEGLGGVGEGEREWGVSVRNSARWMRDFRAGMLNPKR